MNKGFYEFFAGVGLVRLGLEPFNWNCLWANDIAPKKQITYQANFGRDKHFLLEDVWKVRASSLPTSAFLATASFPCVDLSLAGKQKGLTGKQSGSFYAFIQILNELKAKGDKPPVVLLENVQGFLTVNNGQAIRQALDALDALGYAFDLFLVDAVNFVPQSRPRVFVVAVDKQLAPKVMDLRTDEYLSWLFKINSDEILRPKAVKKVMDNNPDLPWGALNMPLLKRRSHDLKNIVEHFSPDDESWWPVEKKQKIYGQMSDRDKAKLAKMMEDPALSFGTIYRRVRDSVSRAELRVDGVAGCLRTPKGGSSKQILLQAGHNDFHVRWMTPREYARLQGVPDSFCLPDNKTDALFAMGDAVCVPAISWLVEHAIEPCYSAYHTLMLQPLAS